MLFKLKGYFYIGENL